MTNPVIQFERKIADFFNAPYAVAVDSCTHAVELALRYTNSNNVTCPARTYPSIPMTFIKLNLNWNFTSTVWQAYYQIGNTNIIDAATFWKRHGYEPGTFMCLSFQSKKHLSLGRGGAILVNNAEDYRCLKLMSCDGRDPDLPWQLQNIKQVGFHYHMTYETAEIGIAKFNDAAAKLARTWSSDEYIDLRTMDVFSEKSY